MKFKSTMLSVKDMDRSISFYKKVLGLHVIMDAGTNVTLTGGIALQTNDSWEEFISVEKNKNISYGGNDAEIYFEEDKFDKFADRLNLIDGIIFVHSVIEHRWGQRAVRFYDPDMHIIEVGENLKTVCRRFLESGMTVEETAERMDVPVKFVNSCNR